MDEIEDIKHRHITLKHYLENRNWDKSPTGNIIEFDLIRDVVKNLHGRKPILKSFVYIYDYEWEAVPGRTDKNKGDLVFTDGKNNFLIVECKLRDSNYVRIQVRELIDDLKKIKPNIGKICGLAVSKDDWDYLDENGRWHYEKVNEYFQSYDNLILDPDQLDIKSRFQEYYINLGYKPKDPTSALNELEQQNFLELNDNSEKLDNNPPFIIEIRALLNDIQAKEYIGKGEALNKRKAKALASANICEQVFLEYDMTNLSIPIKLIEKGEVFRIKSYQS